MLPHRVEKLVGLRMQPCGVQRKHSEPPAGLVRHVDQHNVLGTAERNGDVGTILANAQRHDVARVFVGILRGHRRQVLDV